MKTSLIVAGKSLRINNEFLEYIFSHIKKQIDTIDTIFFLDKNDKNIFIDLEKIINENETTIIVASKDNFNLISKVVATLHEDNLELKEDTLIPANSNEFSKDSFLLKKNDKQISIICAKENSKLPSLHVNSEKKYITFSLIGLDEDSTKILLEPLASTYNVKLTSTPIVEGWSKINIISSKYGEAQSFLDAAHALFPDKLIASDNVLEYIVNSLIKAKKKIATAESCTGGLIASLITSISGSSYIFDGGIVSYSNDIKRSWLGVSKETLENYGAVSELCVREMMEGALNTSLADFSVATSGIAGPTGGSEEKPVGTVFIGARNKQGEVLVERLLLRGDREYIQKQSAYHALRLLLLVGKETFFTK